MGIAGMNNRIKTNLSLKNKSNKYRKVYFNRKVNWDEKMEFKKPTTDDLLKNKESNREFLAKEKRKNRIHLGLSFLIVITVYFWLF